MSESRSVLSVVEKWNSEALEVMDSTQSGSQVKSQKVYWVLLRQATPMRIPAKFAVMSKFTDKWGLGHE